MTCIGGRLVGVPLGFKKMAFIAGVQMLQSITVLSKAQTLKFKRRLHNCVFPAVSHKFVACDHNYYDHKQ